MHHTARFTLLFLIPFLGLFLGACQDGTGTKGEGNASGGGVKAGPDWMAPRTWISGDGRTLEGALVARIGEDGVLRRSPDGVVLRLPPRFLSPDSVNFLRSALESGTIPTTLSDVWFVRTKMTIAGGEAWVGTVDTSIAIGPRIAKMETSYWLLLSELDGSDAKWARVDNLAFAKAIDGGLLPHRELANQRNASGAFLDEVPCPRLDTYIIDARYGLPSRRINVTRAMMGLLAAGRLPLTIGPEVFGLPDHAPDVWDVTITWQRVGEGAVTRTVRDGSILAWPSMP
jgi:hypothetical protein